MNQGISVKIDHQAIKGIERKTARGLNVAAQYVRAEIVKAISISARAAGPSLSGQFPHARTGNLRKTITVRPATASHLVARVGTTLAYGRYLEIGTKRMKARPFISRIIRERRRQIDALVAATIKRSN